MTNRYDIFRNQIDESNDRFQAAMLQAIHAHTATVAAVGELLRSVETHETQLEESIDQLKHLVMEQGVELRAMRERFNGGA